MKLIGGLSNKLKSLVVLTTLLSGCAEYTVPNITSYTQLVGGSAFAKESNTGVTRMVPASEWESQRIGTFCYSPEDQAKIKTAIETACIQNKDKCTVEGLAKLREF